MDIKKLNIKFSSMPIIVVISALIGTGISYYDLYLYHIFLCLYLFLFFIIRKTIIYKYEITLPTKYHYFFYFFFLYYCFTIIWSWNRISSILYIFFIFNGGFVALLIIYYLYNTSNFTFFLKKISIIIFIEIVISLLEIFTSFRWLISPYSKYVSFFGREGSQLSNYSPLLRKILLMMPTGFQWNPNNLAVKMIIIIPFFLFLENKIIKYLGFAACSIIIFASLSRGNIIAWIFILLLYFFIYYKALNKKILIILLLIIIIIIVFNFPFFQKNLETINQLTKAVILYFNALLSDSKNMTSVGIRGQLIRRGIEALIDSYFIGVGGNASDYIHEEKIKSTRGKAEMHNFWIEILVEGGVLFFLIFMVWYFKIFFKLLRIRTLTRSKNIRYFSSACSLSMTGFFLGAISASSVIYFLPMWILFGLSIATINSYMNELKHTTSISSETIHYPSKEM